MANSLDPDQARQNVGPDLDPICLQRLSADNTGRSGDIRIYVCYEVVHTVIMSIDNNCLFDLILYVTSTIFQL